MNETVGLIGLGNAGSALASAFSGQRPLAGFDLNPARRDAVAALDLQWAGSVADVAGVTNERGNVLGLMPHPEHAVEAGLGGEDGRVLLGSLLDAVKGETP